MNIRKLENGVETQLLLHKFQLYRWRIMSARTKQRRWHAFTYQMEGTQRYYFNMLDRFVRVCLSSATVNHNCLNFWENLSHKQLDPNCAIKTGINAHWCVVCIRITEFVQFNKETWNKTFSIHRTVYAPYVNSKNYANNNNNRKTLKIFY